MGYDPERHHRRSIRLKGYDYAQAGAYFVTLCIHQRRSILGHIDSGIFYPSPAGLLIQTLWAELPQHYPGVALDAFTLMPNHLHGIILLQPTPGSPNLTLGLSSTVLSPSPPLNIENGFTIGIGNPLRVGSGNATTTNTSFAPRIPAIGSALISSPIPNAGQKTPSTPTIPDPSSIGNPANFGPLAAQPHFDPQSLLHPSQPIHNPHPRNRESPHPQHNVKL